MSGMVGMNVGEGRDLARAFMRQSAHLDHLQHELESCFAQLSWIGPDGAELRHLWRSHLRPKLHRVSTELQRAGTTLNRQADQQEEASGGRGSSSPGILAWIGGAAGDVVGDVQRGAAAVGQTVTDGVTWLGNEVAGGIDWLGDRAAEGAEWVNDRVEDGIDWTRDRIDDGVAFAGSVWDAAVERGSAVVNGWIRFGEAEVNLLTQFIQPLWTGRPPQLAEILAGSVIVLGTGVGAVWNTATLSDAHLFDDGKPWTGKPSYSNAAVSPPRDFAGLTRLTVAAYDNGPLNPNDPGDTGQVQVTVIRNPGQPPRYIVSLPGTQAEMASPDGWTGKANGRDWAANLYAVGNGSSAAGEAAKTAVLEAIALDRAQHPGEIGLPDVLLTGHSQGGILAANLAADPAFASQLNIGGVVTFASPTDCAPVPQSIPMLSVEHGTLTSSVIETGPGQEPIVVTDVGDLVPRLDLGGVATGSEGNVTHVRTPSFGPWTDIRANHEQLGYVNSVDAMADPAARVSDPVLADNYATVQTWSQRNDLSRYYTVDGGQSQTIQVPFGRTTR